MSNAERAMQFRATAHELAQSFAKPKVDLAAILRNPETVPRNRRICGAVLMAVYLAYFVGAGITDAIDSCKTIDTLFWLGLLSISVLLLTPFVARPSKSTGMCLLASLGAFVVGAIAWVGAALLIGIHLCNIGW